GASNACRRHGPWRARKRILKLLLNVDRYCHSTRRFFKEEQIMNSENYEYRGFLASAWDLLRGDTSDWPDRAFYRDILLQNGQPALDIECGPRRLYLGYLASAHDMDVFD